MNNATGVIEGHGARAAKAYRRCGAGAARKSTASIKRGGGRSSHRPRADGHGGRRRAHRRWSFGHLRRARGRCAGGIQSSGLLGLARVAGAGHGTATCEERKRGERAPGAGQHGKATYLASRRRGCRSRGTGPPTPLRGNGAKHGHRERAGETRSSGNIQPCCIARATRAVSHCKYLVLSRPRRMSTWYAHCTHIRA
jgi:hypothetical protein